MELDWPDQQEVRRLIDAGGLTGAEYEVLNEYLTQSREEWRREVSIEDAAKVLLPEEMDLHGICSEREAETAEHGYANALVDRVENILQNHSTQLIAG